ncbi:hypothetical protein ACFX2K_019419 [Malus domestica]
MTRSQTSQTSKPSSAHPIEYGKKKQKSSRPPATKKLAFAQQKSQSSAKVQQSVKEVLAKILEELKDTKAKGTSQPEPYSLPARSVHLSPSLARPIKANGGTPEPQVGQTSVPSSFTLPSTMVVTPTSQFNSTNGEMLHYVEDDNTSSSPVHETIHQSTPTFGEPIVPEIPIFFEVTSPKTPQASSRAS